MSYWLEVKDGDPRARALHRRHYSARQYRDGREPKLFAGPGYKIVLIVPGEDNNATALLVWRKFRSLDNQQGINCAVFRNESSGILSSVLLREAMAIAWQRWPGERLYTYVNPNKIRSTNPGHCFKKAGWAVCGKSKRGLVILEALPPAPVVAVEPGRAPDRAAEPKAAPTPEKTRDKPRVVQKAVNSENVVQIVECFTRNLTPYTVSRQHQYTTHSFRMQDPGGGASSPQLKLGAFAPSFR